MLGKIISIIDRPDPYLVNLPKHSLMCECRRCVVSIRTYVKRLGQL